MVFAPTSVCFAKQDLVTQKGFDFLALHLEKSTFKDLKRIFGQMQLKHGLTSIQTLTTACYESKDGAVLQFGSSVVGGGRFITQLTLSLAAARGTIVNCHSSRKFSAKSKFSNQLRLGLAKSAVIRKFGPPGTESKGLLSYSFTQTWPKGILESLILKIGLTADDKVQQIELEKLTSH